MSYATVVYVYYKLTLAVMQRESLDLWQSTAKRQNRRHITTLNETENLHFWVITLRRTMYNKNEQLNWFYIFCAYMSWIIKLIKDTLHSHCISHPLKDSQISRLSFSLHNFHYQIFYNLKINYENITQDSFAEIKKFHLKWKPYMILLCLFQMAKLYNVIVNSKYN